MVSKLNLLQLKTLRSCYKTLLEAQDKINRLTLQVDDEDLHALSKYIATDVGYARGCMKARGDDGK
jgi:hypothetical protein